MEMQSKYQNPNMTLSLSYLLNVTIIIRFSEDQVISGVSCKAS